MGAAGHAPQRRAVVARPGMIPATRDHPDHAQTASATLVLWLQALRCHQWSKNLLVFLPLVLSHKFSDLRSWSLDGLIFVSMSLVASAGYLANDLLDAESDRAHPGKSGRPIASGRISSSAALAAAVCCIVAGIWIASRCSSAAAVGVTSYALVSFTYSLWFKRIALLDLILIGLMFTMRLVIGCLAIGLALSPWLMAFAFSLFFSMATAKRHTELVRLSEAQADPKAVAGRGYLTSDDVLVLCYGVASGLVSLVILLLYITEGIAATLYRHVGWLWAVPLLLHTWQSRIWILSHRGRMHDDPMVFALKDPVSWLLGAGCAAAFYLAL
jgi:4-hydroxybenzoate polyprenyltransferase